jgi:hypothetical protein
MRSKAAAALTPHWHPWVNLPHDYIARVTTALAAGGLFVGPGWLDPYDPRDATIVYSDPASIVPAKKLALVWDEITGWRRGNFIGGEQGVRTQLADVTYLGGGVLPTGDQVLNRVRAGVGEPRRAYRSVEDLRDGLDDKLQGRN